MKKSKRFAHTPESVTLARRFAGKVLESAPRDVRDAVALMISELASNCIRHTDGSFEVTIIHTGSEVRVEATDAGRAEPRMRTPSPTDEHGRGLRIVDMLASSWGFEPLPEGGKTVWFALDEAAGT